MSARLFCRFGQLAGAEYEIGREATIGSASENGVVLSAPSISRRQARIAFDGQSGCYFLEDLSGGGTALDGQPVEGRMRLSSVHVLTFAGQHDFFFHWNPRQPPQDQLETVGLDELPQAAAEPPASQTIFRSSQKLSPPPAFQPLQPPEQTAADPDPQASETMFRESAGVSLPDFLKPGSPPQEEVAPEPQLRLVLELKLPDGAKAYPLGEGENVVGRSPQCEVFVDDPTLSRRHAVLTVKKEALKVRDLGSTNKTFVEGEAIGRETALALETPISFAKVAGKVRLEEA